MMTNREKEIAKIKSTIQKAQAIIHGSEVGMKLLAQSASIIDQLVQMIQERTGGSVQLYFIEGKPLVFLEE